MKDKNKFISKCMRCNCNINFKSKIDKESDWGNFTKSTLLCENCKRFNSFTEGMVTHF